MTQIHNLSALNQRQLWTVSVSDSWHSTQNESLVLHYD